MLARWTSAAQPVCDVSQCAKARGRTQPVCDAWKGGDAACDVSQLKMMAAGDASARMHSRLEGRGALVQFDVVFA